MNLENNISADFDRIAELPEDKWDSNSFFHRFIISNLPGDSYNILEIGCGKGKLLEQLAQNGSNVTGVDLSEGMVEMAIKAVEGLSNIRVLQANYLSLNSESEKWDCIVSVATLHHIDFDQFALKVKKELNEGGILIIIDLFQSSTLLDYLLGVLSFPLKFGTNLVFNGRLFAPKAHSTVWDEHAKKDVYLKYKEIKTLAKRHFPGAKISRRLFWRYSLIWDKDSVKQNR